VLVGVRSTFWTLQDQRSLRFSGPFTYPSAVGLFLVISLIAGTQVVTTNSRLRRLVNCVRAVTVLGIVATDSRGAVVGLAVALCFRVVRRELGTAVIAAVIGAPVLLLGQRTHASHLLVVAAVIVAAGLAQIPDGVVRRVGMKKRAVAVRGTRSVKKADLIHNNALPKIEVDSQTYEVRADGQLLTCEPASVLPLAQRYFLF